MPERFYNFFVSNRGIVDNVIRVSAPTRIDLAGGTIDIWPLYLFHDGASTVNAAISLRARVRVEPRSDGGIELRSLDSDRHVSAAQWSDLDVDGDRAGPARIRPAHAGEAKRAHEHGVDLG